MSIVNNFSIAWTSPSLYPAISILLKKMKGRLLCFLILLGLTFFCCKHPTHIRQVHTPDAELLMSKLVQEVKENHFNPRVLDDTLSQDLFAYYLKQLDPKKEFLTQQDLKQLNPYQLTLDEAITNQNFEFFNTAVSLLENGILKAECYTTQLLGKTQDFSRQETLEINFDFLDFAPNDRALKERWRKKLKKYTLDQLYLEDKRSTDSESDKQLTRVKEKVQMLLSLKFEQLRAITDKNRIEDYANAFLKVHDYQSEYLSPKEKSAWDDDFTRSFVGIGARLVMEEGYPTIKMILPGGAAWKAKTLEEGEKILNVRDEGSDSGDLFGKSIDDVINSIKGKKGTTVYLSVKGNTSHIREVAIIRDKIEFDLAMSFLLEDQKQSKIGYIRLPRFYAGDPGSAVHILNEINTLKANQVDGIIFDVRNNKGGSGGECRDIVGYFLNDGTYMQTKRSNGDLTQYDDRDPSVQYRGKLLVLTNSESGSASELLAGTLQDYKRALIVGGQSTFGKGSMQNFIDLNENNDKANAFGQIKLTVGQFYTASGRSPQSTGVIPDIKLPDDQKYVASGERGKPFSMSSVFLPLIEVNQEVFVVNDIDVLKRKSEQRTQRNKQFQIADRKAKHLLTLEGSQLVELQKEKYFTQKDVQASLETEWDDIYSEIKDLKVSFDKKPFALDSAALIKRERWVDQIKSDPYIYECYQIINEMVG